MKAASIEFETRPRPRNSQTCGPGRLDHASACITRIQVHVNCGVLTAKSIAATHEKGLPSLNMAYPCSPPEVRAGASPRRSLAGGANPQPNPPVIRVRGSLTDQLVIETPLA